MKKIIALFILIILIYSCKKNSSASSSQSRYNLLVDKKWKIIAISGYTTSGQYVTDDFSNLPDYDKDDYLYFYNNLNYEQNAGPLKQPGDTAQILDYGTWVLTTSDQFISCTSFVPGTTIPPLKILILNKTTLRFQENEPFSGNLVTYTFTAE